MSQCQPPMTSQRNIRTFAISGSTLFIKSAMSYAKCSLLMSSNFTTFTWSTKAVSCISSCCDFGPLPDRVSLLCGVWRRTLSESKKLK